MVCLSDCGYKIQLCGIILIRKIFIVPSSCPRCQPGVRTFKFLRWYQHIPVASTSADDFWVIFWTYRDFANWSNLANVAYNCICRLPRGKTAKRTRWLSTFFKYSQRKVSHETPVTVEAVATATVMSWVTMESISAAKWMIWPGERWNPLCRRARRRW